MKSQSKQLFLIAVLTVMSFLTVRADIDKKLYERAAKYVWGTPSPNFTTTADLSDPIFQNQAAVYIARLFSLNANYDSSPDMSKATTLHYSNSNAIDAIVVRRSMVKLNEASAVEYFTDFSIDAPVKQDINGYTIVKINPAFGARIYKPDGSVRTVDMKQALTVTEGKKNKDSEYKIAIPGLEVGDILDYFYYTEYFLDELSLPAIRVPLLAQYPTRTYTISLNSSPELALEYGAFNGAQVLPNYIITDGKCVTSITLNDIESFTEKPKLAAISRQLPFYKFYCLNNRARLEFIPSSARSGGIRMVNQAFLNADIASSLNKTKNPDALISSAKNIYNSWATNHSQANERQKIDALWLSVNYAAMTSSQSFGEPHIAIAFYRLLPTIGCTKTPYIGYTSPRTMPALKEMARFTEADLLVAVGDTTYFVNNDLIMVPGDIPPHLDNEECVLFKADPDNTQLQTMTIEGHTPKSFAARNTVTVVSDIKIDPTNDEILLVNSQYAFAGAAKSHVDDLVSVQLQVKAIDQYLGQNSDKMFKKFDVEADKKAIDEEFDNVVKQIWDSKDAKINKYEVTEAGTTPDQPQIKFQIDGSVEGAVTIAGNDMLVNIGRFIGKQAEYIGEDRERTISIIHPYPVKNSYSIRFTVPEGYSPVEESLAAFDSDIKSSEAALYTKASYSNGVVTLDVMERYNYSINQLKAWPTILEIADTLKRITQASIVIRPN